MPLNEFIDLYLHACTLARLCDSDPLMMGYTYQFDGMIDKELNRLGHATRCEYIATANRALAKMLRA